MLFPFLRKEKKLTAQQQLAQWEKAGRPAPPPHIVKQQIIAVYVKKYNVQTLVETGTYLGEMVFAQKDNFKKIYSVELSEKLHKKAVKKFSSFKHITLMQGDSGFVLKKIVNELSGPALFWLDGHFSGGMTALADKECPVPEELATIFTSHYHHVVLIDDARLFDGTKSYPTINEIKEAVNLAKKYQPPTIKDDIICIEPLAT